MAIDVLRCSGAAKIIAIETNETRRKLAKEMGAHVVINPLCEDVVARVLEETNNNGVDVVAEFAGNAKALELALDYTKKGGSISILGIFKDKVEFDINKVVFKGLNLYGVTGRKMYKNWHQIDKLLKTKKLRLDKVVTHKLNFNEMDKAFQIMDEKNCGKVVIKVSK